MKTPIYTGIFQSDLEAAGYRISGLPTPFASSDAATKGYVDIHAGGGGGGTNPLITVNVKDAPYSAVGDGVIDDSAAIQAAITAVHSSGGGTVFFPRGTYLCNGAFDGTSNSILSIPVVSLPTNIPLQFLGETGPVGAACSIIKSTKTGTGTLPALLGDGPPWTGGILTNPDENFTMVYIRNLNFVLNGNPTIGAIRLPRICWAVLEDLEVAAGDAEIEPTHGTVGIAMPFSGNGGRNYIRGVRVYGFGTGVQTGEHFRTPDLFLYRCKTGIEFLAANDPSWAVLEYFQCPIEVKFSGYHPVQLFLDVEHSFSGTGLWYAPGAGSITDPSNYGRGVINYHLVEESTGPIDGPLSVSGGNYLTLTNLRTMATVLAPNATFRATPVYIGTDARLVSISGGVKLEVRDPGAGTWVEGTRYTNP